MESAQGVPFSLKLSVREALPAQGAAASVNSKGRPGVESCQGGALAESSSDETLPFTRNLAEIWWEAAG